MIARKSFLNFVKLISRMLLGLVGTYYVANHLGPEPMGTIAFFMGFVGTVNLFVNMGFKTAHIQLIASGEDPEDCISTYSAVKIIQVALLILISLIAFHFTKGLFNELASFYVLVFILMEVCFRNIGELASITFEAEQKTGLVTISAILPALVLAGGQIFVALGGFGATELAVNRFVSAVVFFLICLYLFQTYSFPKPSFICIREYLKLAMPLAIESLISVFTTYLDMLLIKVFWTAIEVGYLAAAQRLLILMEIIPLAIIQLVFPSLSRYYANDQTDEVSTLLNKVLKYNVMIVLPLCLLIMALSKPIVTLFLGDKFLPATPIIFIYPIRAIFQLFCMPIHYYLIASNRVITLTKIIFVGAIFQVICLLIFIPKEIFGIPMMGMGALGSVISMIIVQIVSFTLLIYVAFIKEKMRIRIVKDVVVLFLSGLVMFGGVYYWGSDISSWSLLIFTVFAGIIGYVIMLVITGQAKKTELDYIKNVLNLKEMKEYIKSEIKTIN